MTPTIRTSHDYDDCEDLFVLLHVLRFTSCLLSASLAMMLCQVRPAEEETNALLDDLRTDDYVKIVEVQL